MFTLEVQQTKFYCVSSDGESLVKQCWLSWKEKIKAANIRGPFQKVGLVETLEVVNPEMRETGFSVPERGVTSTLNQ